MFGMPTINTDGRHPTVQDLCRYFDYDHLQPPMREVSMECYDLAASMIHALPDSPQLVLGLQKVLEAKDCFVRAALTKRDAEAVELSASLQEVRKAAIQDLDARLARISPENPMGVEMPSDEPLPGV